jgi:hypothetical protein
VGIQTLGPSDLGPSFRNRGCFHIYTIMLGFGVCGEFSVKTHCLGCSEWTAEVALFFMPECLVLSIKVFLTAVGSEQ